MSQLPVFAEGQRISKGPLGLPQNTTTTLFTVTGLIYVYLLVGVVTTAVSSTTLTMGPGLGSASSPFPLGTMLLPTVATLTATQAVEANFSEYGYIGPANLCQMLVASSITWGTNSSGITGQVQWSLYYRPIASGASVS